MMWKVPEGWVIYQVQGAWEGWETKLLCQVGAYLVGLSELNKYGLNLICNGGLSKFLSDWFLKPICFQKDNFDNSMGIW